MEYPVRRSFILLFFFSVLVYLIQIARKVTFNEASWEKTLQTGEAHYWSRSRQEIWHKGGTSGNVQIIREIYADCDNDTVLFRVEQVGGAACHTGYETCFHKAVDRDGLVSIVGERVFDPEEVYGK